MCKKLNINYISGHEFAFIQALEQFKLYSNGKKISYKLAKKLTTFGGGGAGGRFLDPARICFQHQQKLKVCQFWIECSQVFRRCGFHYQSNPNPNKPNGGGDRGVVTICWSNGSTTETSQNLIKSGLVCFVPVAAVSRI